MHAGRIQSIFKRGKGLKMKQFIRFGIVGISNTAVSYAVYIICIAFFRYKNIFPDKDYLAASVLSFLVSVSWSFCWNHGFTFKIQKRDWKTTFLSLLKSYACYAVTGLFVNNALLYVFTDRMGIHEYIAFLIAVSVTVPVNFILNKRWVFGSGEK